MLYIAKNELVKQLKSVKSIIFIFIFVFISYYTSNYFKANISTLKLNNTTSFYSSLRLLVFIFGYMFASTLSFNSINKEIELKTIRLAISKKSRISFFLGKLIGAFSFWIICLSISFLVISIVANTLDIEVLIMILVCMFYFISIIFFFSTLIEKQSLSNFIGLIVGLAMPLLGLWTTLSNSNIFFKIIRYVFPYEYLLNSGLYLIFPVIIGCIINLIAIVIFNRKDL